MPNLTNLQTFILLAFAYLTIFLVIAGTVGVIIEMNSKWLGRVECRRRKERRKT